MVVAKTLFALAGMGLHVGATDPNPYQRVKACTCTGKHNLFEVGYSSVMPEHVYYMATREFEPKSVYTHVWERAATGITGIDACDISPIDDNMYCMVQRTVNGKFSYDLARVDCEDGTLAYVAAGPRDSANQLEFYGAAFNLVGNYIARTNGGLYNSLNPDKFIGYTNPTTTINIDTNSVAAHGYDIVVANDMVVSLVDGTLAGQLRLVKTPLKDALFATTNVAPTTISPTVDSDTLPDDFTTYTSAWMHNGNIYVQRKTGELYKIVLSADANKYTATLITTGVAGANDGAYCKYVKCACPENGNVVDTWCPISNPHKCDICEDGHHMVNSGLCKPNQCSCEHGKVGTSCSAHGSSACVSCDDGYHLFKDAGKGTTCVPNKCTCANGTGKEGVDCSANNSEECDECDEGYRIAGDICVRDDTGVVTPPITPPIGSG